MISPKCPIHKINKDIVDEIEGCFVYECPKCKKKRRVKKHVVQKRIFNNLKPLDEESALNFQEGGDHYKKYPIQPVVFCYVNKIPAIESAIIGYVIRHQDKGQIKDLEKAIHYLEILKDLAYGDKNEKF